jgi:hypothetical protein
LPFKHFGVMDVMTAQSAAPRRTIMATFTINETNEIVAFATPEEASAAAQTPFDSFTSQDELAELAKTWPAERLLAILNSLPGEKPAKKLKDPKAAIARIWARIQGLGEAAQPEPEAAKPRGDKKAKGGARAAKGAKAEAAGPREGSKMAQVIAMLQRAKGATISEIMDRMQWQRHTVRGFMAGAMKKAGYTVESFKPEGGERSYRLPK